MTLIDAATPRSACSSCH